MLSLVLMFPDLVKTELENSFVEKECSFLEKAIREPPLTVDVGSPCGVNDFALDGGGPAGVVDTLLHKLRERSLSGVSGGLDS